LSKFSYCSNLSLNSTCRDYLSKISLIWLTLELATILTPISATSLQKEYIRSSRGIANCLIYEQVLSQYASYKRKTCLLIENHRSSRRKWGTNGSYMNDQSVADLIFGTSLGYMKSEASFDHMLPNTTSIVTPQVFEIIEDGSMITGPGFVTTISSQCQCTAGSTVANILKIAPHLTNDTAGVMLNNSQTMNTILGLVNRVDFDNYTLTITTLLANTKHCGGVPAIYLPICTTKISDHYHATVSQVYMSDGSQSTVTQRNATIVSLGARAKMSWLYAAMSNMLDGVESAFLLPSTVPGLLNPLMWWATSGTSYHILSKLKIC